MDIATYDVETKQKGTFVLLVTWKDANGNPINLTGYTAAMQVRTTSSAATATYSFSTAAGSIVLGGALGTITITGTAANMIHAGNFIYDLYLTSGAQVTPLLEGSFTVVPAVTQ